MAAADSVFESLQRIPSVMESFDESLSQLRKDNISESALDLRKNPTEYYHDLHKALQLKYETLKIKEEREELETSGENKENETSNVTGSNPAIFSFTKVLSCADVRSEIKTLCDKADGRGLRNYVIDNMKEVKTLRKELPLALREAPDVAKLVMNALEPPFSRNRNACILILKSFYKIFGNDDSFVVPSYVKDSAREIVKDWRKYGIEKKTGRASRGNIRAFLRFLASFRIAADCERDELWGLLLAVSSDVTTPDLCRSLGLTPNVSS
jgi:hypothetical protein